MATIQATLQLEDRMSSVINQIERAMSGMMSTFVRAQAVVSQGLSTAGIDNFRTSVVQTREELEQYQEALVRVQGAGQQVQAPQPSQPQVQPPLPADPSPLPALPGGGAGNLAGELQMIDAVAQRLSETMGTVTIEANSMSFSSASMRSEFVSLESEIQSVSLRIQQLEQIPVDLQTEQQNGELAELRMQLEQAVVSQQKLSMAAQRMDVSASNAEYRQLRVSIQAAEKKVEDTTDKQEELNNSILKSISTAGGLAAKMSEVAMKAVKAVDVQKVMAFSDNITQTSIRLGHMNDGLQTTEQLNQNIVASAMRARAPYAETAAAITNMGLNASSAFSSNDELIAFVEQANKQFALGGSSAQDQASAMEQLSQAMANGSVSGDQLNSILSAAPQIAGVIEQSMGWAEDSIKSYAEEGQLSAQVVKNALLSTAEETNTKFNALPMTFEQLKTVAQDTLLNTFMPLIQLIGEGANFIRDNWDTIAPLMFGVGVAVLLIAIGWGIYTVATWLAVAANQMLIATILSNPILWLAIIIALVVAEIYKWVQSVGGLQIAWLICVNAVLTQADRMILGFMAAQMNILNTIDSMIYGFTALRYGVMNALGNMRANGLMIIQDFINGAIGMINDLIATVNSITGTAIEPIAWVADFGTKAVEEEAAKQLQRAEDLAALNDKNEKAALNRQENHDNERLLMEAAARERQAEIEALKADKAQKAAEEDPLLSAVDGFGADAGGGAGSPAGNIAGNTGQTAANTAAMADSMDIIDEDLKYMRDAAEQEIINRFTLAELKVDVQNNNTLTKKTDFSDMGSFLSSFTGEFLAAAAEGGHI